MVSYSGWLTHCCRLQAEKDGEEVHILGHIPSGGCMRTWSREFGRIIDRFVNYNDVILMSYKHNMHYIIAKMIILILSCKLLMYALFSSSKQTLDIQKNAHVFLNMFKKLNNTCIFWSHINQMKLLCSA
jgi:hypothetical protein